MQKLPTERLHLYKLVKIKGNERNKKEFKTKGDVYHC